MPPARTPEGQHRQSDASATAEIGGWLFRYRTLIPVPFFLALIFVRAGQAPPSFGLTAGGIAIVLLGEGIRFWGVHHIGAISRTRTDRLGPLIDDGPFARVRNPLYLGNIVLWIGFALIARLVWMAPLLAIVLGLEYHAIVRWEEGLLESRIGDAYRDYMTRVPRWIPALHHRGPRRALHDSFSWRDTFFSERGTLIAIVVGYGLLWLIK